MRPGATRGLAEADVKTLLMQEIDAYEKAEGPQAAGTMCAVLMHVIRWVRRDGHGSCTVHAIDHRLGDKIKAETVLTVKEAPEAN